MILSVSLICGLWVPMYVNICSSVMYPSQNKAAGDLAYKQESRLCITGHWLQTL